MGEFCFRKWQRLKLVIVSERDLQFLNFCLFDESIRKLAKKGLTPSKIGVILRESHSIPQVKSVTGSKILIILKAHGSRQERTFDDLRRGSILGSKSKINSLKSKDYKLWRYTS